MGFNLAFEGLIQILEKRKKIKSVAVRRLFAILLTFNLSVFLCLLHSSLSVLCPPCFCYLKSDP